jgi:hypothetical protein
MQIWTPLLAVFAGLVALSSAKKAAVPAKQAEKHHGHHGHRRHCSSSSSSSDNQDIHVHLKADVGFYAFDFGGSSTPVWTDFFFKSRNVTAVTITDCYCEGDWFSFYDNGKHIGNTWTGCAGCVGDACNFYSTNPWNCMWDRFHCTGGAFLTPGCHNITIMTERSVFNSGTAFIRLDTVCTYEGYLIPCCALDNSCAKGIYN